MAGYLPIIKSRDFIHECFMSFDILDLQITDAFC